MLVSCCSQIAKTTSVDALEIPFCTLGCVCIRTRARVCVCVCVYVCVYWCYRNGEGWKKCRVILHNSRVYWPDSVWGEEKADTQPDCTLDWSSHQGPFTFGKVTWVHILTLTSEIIAVPSFTQRVWNLSRISKYPVSVTTTRWVESRLCSVVQLHYVIYYSILTGSYTVMWKLFFIFFKIL